MKDRRLLGLAVALLLAVATWWVQSGSSDPSQEPAAPGAASTDSGDTADLPVVAEATLPDEARTTLRRIDEDGPFPYDRDGVVFENREGLLPSQDAGYYREYTVDTPGSDDRGARRIVSGADGDFYYTSDHYRSFVRIDRG